MYWVDSSGCRNTVVEEGVDTLRGVDRLHFDDIIVAALAPATEAADTILGMVGGDSIAALGGNDSVAGEAGVIRSSAGPASTHSRGDDAADTLDGAAGANSLGGGLGDDLFLVDDANDRVSEGGGQGADTVRATASFVLPVNIEALVLLGSAVAGTGNTLANVIVGTDGANTLCGLGGADTMEGGLGDHTYRADALDLLVEARAAGRIA